MVSIFYERGTDYATAQSPFVSVVYKRGPEHGIAQGSFISVTTGPVVQSITPIRITKGTTVTITINGQNLSGTTGLQFLEGNGTPSTNVIASNITVSADGTSLAATVSAAGNATLGRRTAIVVTPNGRSSTSDLGSNAIEVVDP